MTKPARPQPPEWPAAKIKAFRKALEYTQIQFSEMLGTRQQTISQWELGGYPASRRTRTMLTMCAREKGFTWEETSDTTTTQE